MDNPAVAANSIAQAVALAFVLFLLFALFRGPERR
jgi:hypothetical protein